MNIGTIRNFISKYGDLYFSGYKWLEVGKDLAKDSPYTAEWRDQYKQKYIEDWPLDIQKQTTYQNCVEGCFQVKGGTLSLRLVIYDGDAFSGRPVGVRCTFEIPVKKVFRELRDLVIYEADTVAHQQLQKEAEEAYQRRVKELAKILLYQ